MTDQPAFAQNLAPQQVTDLANLALAGVEREFPHKPGIVFTEPNDIRRPRELHPVFYGCFDWHSSVHAHWTLARLLKRHPNHPLAPKLRALLNRQLQPEKLHAEANFFAAPHHRSFERPYGWAWALRLAAELHRWDDVDARNWASAMQPLEERLVDLISDYLPKLTHPVRTGVHPDTAFALAQFLDYARQTDNQRLAELISQFARDRYGSDRDYASHFEPSGEDFFSPSLNECDLLRRIYPQEQFQRWLVEFLPEMATVDTLRKSQLLVPVEVSDVTDGKLVHLAGLNFSRTWCLKGIATAIDPNDPRHRLLQEAAQHHLQAGYQYLFSGHYEGEHWLATFALAATDQ